MHPTHRRLRTLMESSKCTIISKYAIMSQSVLGVKKAYYFTTPVFNQANFLVKPEFEKHGDCYYYRDSGGGLIRIYKDHMILSKDSDHISLTWNNKKSIFLSNARAYLKTEDMMFFPTFNGIIIKHHGNKAKLTVTTSLPYDVRENSKYFAFMKSKFEPIITLNSMFAENRYTDVFYGTVLHSRKITDTSFELEISSNSTEAFQLTYDIGLYEPKLTQDTTVESEHPQENNSYGNTAFLGNSTYYGTQILYSRIDESKINLPKNCKLDTVKLHIPYYTLNGTDFRISVPTKRFCSFGSTWNDRIPYSKTATSGTKNNGYISFDISKYVISKQGEWKPNEGFVLQSLGNHFSIIGTGDNDYTPQIIEITYR